MFILGHSTGALVAENFLNMNKSHMTEDRIAGVIFSAPFFGLSDSVGATPVKKMVVKGLACIADEFVVGNQRSNHIICHNKQYLRHCQTTNKVPPVTSLGMIASFIRSIDRLKPYQFTHPYLMVLAEKDLIVNNRESKVWRDKSKSKIKKLKLMPGAFHELSKEPNNHFIFEEALRFMGERLVDTSKPVKPFGEFKH